MAALRIAHLSDLHVLRDYYGSMLDREPLRQPVPPVEYFLTGLREAVAAKPDLIVLTGDLVHEGTVEDYQYLRQLIERERCGIPVIPVLGIQQITAESFAFGVETVSSTEVIYTETRGYNTCWVDGRHVIMHPHQVFPFHPQICRIPF